VPINRSRAQKDQSQKDLTAIIAWRGIPFSVENDADDRQKNKTPALKPKTYDPRSLSHPLPCSRPRTPSH
ncbi:hypothetical protein QBC45DRAFT_287944, partial [Copromyces sp. CBS 386.78]